MTLVGKLPKALLFVDELDCRDLEDILKFPKRLRRLRFGDLRLHEQKRPSPIGDEKIDFLFFPVFEEIQ